MATILFGRDGKTKYELDCVIKSGGEGVVYSIKGKPNSVAKIYKPERISNQQERERSRDKILAMLDMTFNPYLDGKLIVAWPEDALFDNGKVFQGFVMPKIQQMKSLIWASRPSDRNVLWPNGYRWHYSIAIAFNLAMTIEHLHKSGIIIGDLNTNNILINAKGDVILIDADSFNIRSKSGQIYKCIVGFPEVLPPELQGKDLTRSTSQFTDKTDCFSLAIHVFTLLCNNCHPFGCLNYSVVHGSSSNPQIMDNIVKGYCPYVTGSTGKTVDSALDMDVFPKELRSLFDRTFDYNSTTAIKQSTISNRPSAQEWRMVIGKLYQTGRKTCPVNSLHEYPIDYHKSCPWCAIEPIPTPKSTPTPKPTPASIQPANKTNPINPIVPTSVTPKKSHGFRKFFVCMLVLSALYCTIMFGLANAAVNNGDIYGAKKYMDLFPFSRDVFHEEYDYISGINHYRMGNYETAYQHFWMINYSYKQTSVYRDFCEAHLNNPVDYYNIIYNNIYFEDAAFLLAWSDDIFCRYMKGAWTYESHDWGSSIIIRGEDDIVRMELDSGDDSYTLFGMPEWPGGGNFFISGGVINYRYPDADDYIEFYSIDITSKNAFTLYSYESGMYYDFSKRY